MMPSTSKQAEEPPSESEKSINEPNLEENPEEIEEIVVVGDDHIQEEIIVDGEQVIYADEQDVYEGEDGVEYEAVFAGAAQKNDMFEMYQPITTTHGTFVCRICEKVGKTTEYPDRVSFVAHRYKCHGSFNNNVICPLGNCTEVYASLYSLRRHLGQYHQLPIEVHLQTFTNIGEFEKFRHLLELASGCRYMMHTKQPKYRRQVMHCAKSEHKLVLQTQKHRLPRERMQKEGAACPSVISYRINPANGEVHAYMQLFHIGHAPDSASDSHNANSARPMDVVFPVKPACWAGHCMQYVQIDVYDLEPAVYGTKLYENVLIVTDLKSKFMWARPLLELTRTAIGRILNSIFNEYGVPEGFATAFNPTYIRDTVKSLETVYGVEIREIWNEPLPYHSFEQWLYELSHNELGNKNRWVEQLQFVVMEYNQKHVEEREETPFERMFRRKAPNLYQIEGRPMDEITAKCRRYHSEMRMEEEGMDDHLNTIFEVGTKVFLRKSITKPRRGNNTQFYFGLISDYDPVNNHYPYKVHYSPTDSPWPSERNQFVWVSVFDLLPTIHGISEMTGPEKKASIALLMCSCDGEESTKLFDLSSVGKQARNASRCLLFRNLLCSNQMSRFCCRLHSKQPCRFHEMYPENDESYAKMDNVLLSYMESAKGDLKEIERRNNELVIEGDDGEVIVYEEEEVVEEEEEEDMSMNHPQIQDPRIHRSPPHPHDDHPIDIEGLDDLQEAPRTLADALAPPPLLQEALEVRAMMARQEAPPLLVPQAPPPMEAPPTLARQAPPPQSPPTSSQAPPPLEEEDFEEHKPEIAESEQSPPPKRRKRTKMTSESSTTGSPPMTSSSPSSSASSSSRRASGRKTIRPKNLDDYVE